MNESKSSDDVTKFLPPWVVALEKIIREAQNPQPKEGLKEARK